MNSGPMVFFSFFIALSFCEGRFYFSLYWECNSFLFRLLPPRTLVHDYFPLIPPLLRGVVTPLGLQFDATPVPGELTFGPARPFFFVLLQSDRPVPCFIPFLIIRCCGLSLKFLAYCTHNARPVFFSSDVTFQPREISSCLVFYPLSFYPKRVPLQFAAFTGSSLHSQIRVFFSNLQKKTDPPPVFPL